MKRGKVGDQPWSVITDRQTHRQHDQNAYCLPGLCRRSGHIFVQLHTRASDKKSCRKGEWKAECKCIHLLKNGNIGQRAKCAFYGPTVRNSQPSAIRYNTCLLTPSSENCVQVLRTFTDKTLYSATLLTFLLLPWHSWTLLHEQRDLYTSSRKN